MEKTNAVAALGMFDGMHIGHQALIRRCVQIAGACNAEPVVYTFSNHPGAVLGRQAPKLLMNAAERRDALRCLGIVQVHMEPFTAELANTPPDAFIDLLNRLWNVRGAVVGYNYSFGSRGAGTPELLSELGNVHGWQTEVMEPVLFNGEPVSSTRIRTALAAGDVTSAAVMLGTHYTLAGEVTANRRIGRTIGFPTANLAYSDERMLPLDGVYATDATVEGQTYRAVTNIGTNPTVGGETRTIETHLIDFSGDLYGKTLSVAFLCRLRGEMRFDTLDDLSRRIALDKEHAKSYIAPKIVHF